MVDRVLYNRHLYGPLWSAHKVNALVSGFHQVTAVFPLQAPDYEMPARDVLVVVDKQHVDERAARGADDGDGLRGDFFRHDDAEARSDLCDNPDQRGRALVGDAFLRDVLG